MHLKNKNRIIALTKQEHQNLENSKNKFYLSPKEWSTRFDDALSSMKIYFSLKEVEKLVKDRISGKTNT